MSGISRKAFFVLCAPIQLAHTFNFKNITPSLLHISMSIAYNFPDISISPIREADEDDLINISVSTDGNRPVVHANPNETLPVEIVSSASIHFDTSKSESESGRNASSHHDPLNVNIISPGALVTEKRMHGVRTQNNIASQRESSVEFDLSENSLSGTQESVVPSGDVHHSQQSNVFVPDSNSIDFSSEEAFQQLERSMGRSLFASNSSADIGADTWDPVSQIMRGTRAYVDLKCCPESESSVRAKLRRMGAVVLRSLVPEITHVVFSRGGNKKTLEHVLSRETGSKPFLLDPHWVHDSYNNRARMDELAYSLYGCQYLVDSLRRQSHQMGLHMHSNQSNVNHSEVVELTPDDDLDEINDALRNGHRTHGSAVPNRSNSAISLSEDSLDCNLQLPMTATQLLTRIDALSKRLERCADDNEPHNRNCPSRIRPEDYNYINAATNTCQVDLTPKSSVLRRRTHGAYGLEYRAPGSLAVYSRVVDKENYDAENGMRDITNRMRNMLTATRAATQCPVTNDMRKTTETNLNNIRDALRHNSQVDNRRGGRRGGRGGTKLAIPRNMQLNIPFGGPSISIPESDEQENVTPTAPIRRPIVKTTSDMINRLQCVPSSDEFQNSNETRRRQRRTRVQKSVKLKLEIVLTGFIASEKRQIADEIAGSALRLSVHPKLSDNTRCLVSATGDRTVQLLKAVVMRIPVVSLEWVDTCFKEDRIVPTRDFEYDEWSRVIEARASGSFLFRRLGKIFVDTECTPPAADICSLIRMSNGTMTTNLNQCTLIIAPEHKDLVLPASRRSLPSPIIVNEKYILDCITRNEVLLMEGYSR